MASRQIQKAYVGNRNSSASDRRVGRIVWLTVGVVFLALLATVIWTWARGGMPPARRPPHPGIGGMPSLGETADIDPSGADPSGADPAEADAANGEGGRAVPMPLATSSAVGEETDDTPPARTPPHGGELIYHGRRDGRMEIALSFDDGPHPRYTPMILDILAEYGIRATFFMVGENVGYYPAAAEAVVAAGHELGNHTFTHRGFNLMNEHEMLAEIAACEDAIAAVSEQKPQFIRPPEGSLNDTMRRVIGSLDYRIVLWDVDTRDWAHTPPDEICAHILGTVQAGDIILMHDFIGHDSPTPEALRRVIPALLARGYHFVTVGELVDGAD